MRHARGLERLYAAFEGVLRRLAPAASRVEGQVDGVLLGTLFGLLGIGLATLGIVIFGIIPTPVIDLVQNSVFALGR